MISLPLKRYNISSIQTVTYLYFIKSGQLNDLSYFTEQKKNTVQCSIIYVNYTNVLVQINISRKKYLIFGKYSIYCFKLFYNILSLYRLPYL